MRIKQRKIVYVCGLLGVLIVCLYKISLIFDSPKINQKPVIADRGRVYSGYTGKQRIPYSSVVFENMQGPHYSGNKIVDLTKNADVTHNVFILWCGSQRFFRFKHYVSVLSIIRFLRPDNLVFVAQQEPIVDNEGYNTWYEELREGFSFFHVIRPPPGACEKRQAFLKAQIRDHGGIAMSEDVIITPWTFSALQEHPSVNIRNTSGAAGFMYLQKSKEHRHYDKQVGCISPESYGNRSDEVCIQANSDFFPKDIWTSKGGAFGELVRLLFYEQQHPIVPRQSVQDLTPNIAHLVWLGGGKMDFLFYMCCLSLLYVVQVETVFIHGDSPPTGLLWSRLQGHPRLRHVYRENFHLVYGNGVRGASHMSDVWRADLMMKYGGIYSDTDVLWIKPIDDKMRRYDAVATYAFKSTHFFPYTLNFGVCMGKRNAKFWQFFVQSMRWFRDKDWTWNGLRQPYKILEHHPDLIHVEPHLQVVCDKLLCHPTWVDDFHDERVNHITNETLLADWAKVANAYHFTWPSPLQDKDSTLRRTDLFARMGQFILQKAEEGMAKEFKIQRKDIVL